MAYIFLHRRSIGLRLASLSQVDVFLHWRVLNEVSVLLCNWLFLSVGMGWHLFMIVVTLGWLLQHGLLLTILPSSKQFVRFSWIWVNCVM